MHFLTLMTEALRNRIAAEAVQEIIDRAAMHLQAIFFSLSLLHARELGARNKQHLARSRSSLLVF